MKKFLTALLAMLLVLSMAACGQKKPDVQDTEDSEQNIENTSENEDPDNSGKTEESEPNPEDYSFLLQIDTCFTNSGIVTVTGRVHGYVKVNDTVRILGSNHEGVTAKVIGIEFYKKQVDSASEGDLAGIILEGITANAAESGYYLVIDKNGTPVDNKPGSSESFEEKTEYTSSDWRAMEFRVDDSSVLTLPLSYEELAQKTGYILRTEDEDTQIEAGEQGWPTVYNAKGCELDLVVINEGTTPCAMKDCTVFKVSSQWGYGSEENNKYARLELCNGLSSEKKLAEIKEIFGDEEPYKDTTDNEAWATKLEYREETGNKRVDMSLGDDTLMVLGLRAGW